MASPRDRRRSRRQAEREMDQAWEALLAGDLATADKASRRAVDAGHVNPRLWNDRGEILVRLGDDVDAEHAFRTAIALAPTFADAFANLAALQADRGRFAQAAHLQRRVCELEPTDRATARLAEYTARAGTATDVAPPDPAATPPQPAAADPDVARLRTELERHGLAIVTRLPGDALAAVAAAVEDAGGFEPAVRHDAESGAFAVRRCRHPAPAAIAAVAERAYATCAAIANAWNAATRRHAPHPADPTGYRTAADRPRSGRDTSAVVELPPGGFAGPAAREIGRRDLPLDVVLCLRADGPAELARVDARPGRRAHRFALRCEVGDLVVRCVRERPVAIAGVLGFQRVLHEIPPAAGARRFLFASFDDV